LAEDRLLETGPTALPYVEDEIQKGRSRIQDYYIHEGYRDVEVILAEPVLNPATRTMDLRISINEGQRFRIASIELVGADAEAQLALNPELQVFSGQVLNSQNLRDMEDLVLNHHQSTGHYDATIY